MMRNPLRHLLLGFAIGALPASAACAADLGVPPPPPAPAIVAYEAVPGPSGPAPLSDELYRGLSVRQGLREDYTPLGAPGVSKRDYYGSPRLYATLHVAPRRWARKVLHRRVVVSARY